MPRDVAGRSYYARRRPRTWHVGPSTPSASQLIYAQKSKCSKVHLLPSSPIDRCSKVKMLQEQGLALSRPAQSAGLARPRKRNNHQCHIGPAGSSPPASSPVCSRFLLFFFFFPFPFLHFSYSSFVSFFLIFSYSIVSCFPFLIVICMYLYIELCYHAIKLPLVLVSIFVSYPSNQQ